MKELDDMMFEETGNMGEYMKERNAEEAQHEETVPKWDYSMRACVVTASRGGAVTPIDVILYPPNEEIKHGLQFQEACDFWQKKMPDANIKYHTTCGVMNLIQPEEGPF